MATISVNTIQNQILFSVPVKDFDEFETPQIEIGRVPWVIRLRKVSAYEESGDRDIINALLVCLYKPAADEKSKWWILAEASLKLLSTCGQPIEKTISKKMFEDGHLKSELKNFISWQDLTDEKNGYMKNGKFTFSATITSCPLRFEVAEIQKFELTSTEFHIFLSDVKSEKFQSFNNHKGFGSYVQPLKVDLSPVIDLRGIKWQVKIVKGPDGLNVHLFNTRDEKNFGWSFNVEFKVKLPSFNDDVEPYEKSFQQGFNTNGVELGWKPFIKIDDLLNKQSNYVRDGNAILEISIAVGPWQPSARTKHLIGFDSTPTISKCAICWAEFIDQEVSVTACGHLFCTACIKPSIEKTQKMRIVQCKCKNR